MRVTERFALRVVDWLWRRGVSGIVGEVWSGGDVGREVEKRRSDDISSRENGRAFALLLPFDFVDDGGEGGSECIVGSDARREDEKDRDIVENGRRFRTVDVGDDRVVDMLSTFLAGSSTIFRISFGGIQSI